MSTEKRKYKPGDLVKTVRPADRRGLGIVLEVLEKNHPRVSHRPRHDPEADTHGYAVHFFAFPDETSWMTWWENDLKKAY